MPLNGFDIVGERAQPNLCPYGAAIKSDAFLHVGNIQPKPKMHGGQNLAMKGGRVSQH
jgi:hypothetical protein